MAHCNENYLNLQGAYLFAEVRKKQEAYKVAHPDANIISLGIGDVTQPLAPVVIEAMKKAVEEMGHVETFRGYGPEQGYLFLREAIAKHDFQDRGCDISPDEIFVSDGAKCDVGNMQEIFAESDIVAITDPVYPVYVDSNVMAGRSGKFVRGAYERFEYLPCYEECGFKANLPSHDPMIIYLCSPNNPTGSALTKKDLTVWVRYAQQTGSVIFFDAAYEAFITEDDVPHSIYECEGARTCAIELRSFSKNAGFTGVRLGFTVIPDELVRDGVSLHSLWARRHGTKFNGAPYIVQKAGEAVYSEAGKAQLKEQVGYYMRNAKLIHDELEKAGFSVSGGVNAPYIWLETPDKMTSWQFFDYLLKEANVVGTPGSGFGAHGEGFFRLPAFGTYENTRKAIDRIKSL